MNRGTKIVLILLRIVIGWHFLYEGAFKLSSQPWERPFSSEPYLQATSGPFRPVFRALVPDRDGFDRLKKESIDASIDNRYQEILDHYASAKPFTDAQKQKLKATADDLKASIKSRLEDTDYERQFAGNMEKLQAVEAQLDRNGLDPAEKAKLQKTRNDLRNTLAKAAGKPITFWDKVKNGDDAKKAVAQAGEESRYLSRLGDYRLMLGRVKQDASRVTAPFSDERLRADRAKLNQTREQLLAIATAPIPELDTAALKLADLDQLKAGPIPGRPNQTWLIDTVTAWGLLFVGLCLLLGVFTPAAALAAGAFLAMFYLAMPPLPGLPEPPNVEGHYLYVNKNLIELVAVLLLAVAPVTTWFSVDYWLERYNIHPLRRLRAQKAQETSAGAKMATVS